MCPVGVCRRNVDLYDGYPRFEPQPGHRLPTLRSYLPFFLHLPMKMQQCSETSAYKIHTPGNYPKESIQLSKNGESLKSRPKHVGDYQYAVNPLTPNDPYRGRTAPLTSNIAFYIFIQQI